MQEVHFFSSSSPFCTLLRSGSQTGRWSVAWRENLFVFVNLLSRSHVVHKFIKLDSLRVNLSHIGLTRSPIVCVALQKVRRRCLFSPRWRRLAPGGAGRAQFVLLQTRKKSFPPEPPNPTRFQRLPSGEKKKTCLHTVEGSPKSRELLSHGRE